MTEEPKTIEHNRHETGGKRWSNRYLILVWVVYAVVGILGISSGLFQWVSFAFGFAVGAAFLGTALALLGSDLPEWMRR
ncbi:hypothetical protein AAFN47_18770 [Hoeflea sp. CAU 1731]